MKKIFKFLLVVIIILALLIGGAMIYLNNFVKPNDFKDKISKVVADKTGRSLVINGDMSWTFYPSLGLKVKNIELAGPTKFRKADFAKVDELEVQVRLLPLIHGNVQTDKIILNGASLHLIKNKAGVSNWSDLLGEENGQANLGSAAAITAIDIENVELNNATVVYDNLQKNKHLKFMNLSLQGKNINVDGTPFSLVISCDAHNAEPLIDGKFAFSGNFTLDFEKQIYQLHNLQLSGQAAEQALTTPLDFSANTEVNIDINKQVLDIPKISVQIGGMALSGDVHVTSLVDAPQVIGNLQTNTFDPKPILHAFGFAKNVPATSLQTAMFKLAMQSTSKFIKVPTLELKFDDTSIAGSGSYSHFTNKYVVFNFDIDQLNLDKYFMQEQREPNALPQARSKAMSAQVASSNGVRDGGKAKLKLLSVLKSVSKSNKMDKLAKAKGKKDTASVSLFDRLKDCMIDGDLHVGKLTFNKARFTDFDLVAHGNVGVIDLNPIKAGLYGGKMDGSLRIETKYPDPRLVTKLNLSKVAVQPLVRDMFSKDKISGVADLNASLDTRGKNGKELLSNLNGSGKIKLNNGVFYGINIREQVDRASALLQQKSIPSSSNADAKTNFGQLTASFKILKGLLSTNDLAVHASNFKVLGNGTVNLASQILDLQLRAYGLITVDKQTNFYVPIKIINTFSEPKFKVDFADMGGQIMREAATKKISDQLEKHGIDKDTSQKLIKSLHLNQIIN
jgi:AsmA protein